MTNRRPGPFPTNTKDNWVVAWILLLPLLAFGNCVTRGSDFGPWHAGYLIQISILLGCVGLCVWLVRRSRIGVILFLLYGGLWTVAPELYWRPKDRAFVEKVMAMKASELPTDWVVEGRSWPCSAWDLIYSDGEFWTLD